MSARTWWSAKAGPKPAEKSDNRANESPDLEMDDLLDARFDEEGRLAQVGRGSRQRIADRLDPRPADGDIDELDVAVQKLTEGLEAIERQSRAARHPDAAAIPEPVEAAGDRDFVTYSLDRLEARLEALSKRLQQRSSGRHAAEPAPAKSARRSDPSLAVTPEDEPRAQLAEARRLAQAEETRRAALEIAERNRQLEAAEQARRAADAAADERRRQADASEARRQAEIAEAKRQSEIAEARRQSEIAEARRQSELAEAQRQNELAEARRETELAEAKRQAEVSEARRQAEIAEARRQAEAAAAAEARQRLAEEAEAIRLADLAEARRNAEAAEARHRAEAEDARRQVEALARREAETAAVLERQFGTIEARIDALQRGVDENQVEPVRHELLEIVQQMTDMSRSGRATTDSLDQVSVRLDEMEVKINAARNMAGNRLGDIQDRLSGMVERLDEIEVEIPGFDAIRLNQGAILERFDRMEGLVHRLVSPEELFERIEGLKRQMQTAASQREVTRIEEQILKLADRLDQLPEDLSDDAALQRLESQLGTLATEFAESRLHRRKASSDLDERLSELSDQLRDVAETGRTPDLSGIEDRLSGVAAQVAEDRRANGDALGRLDRRLGAVAAAIEKQEGDAAILEGLVLKIDSLADAIDAQDASGARRDVEMLGRKLDKVGEELAAHAEHLSRRQIGPLETRLDDIQAQIEELAKRTPDQRTLQAQIESIVSRLELLKGRSIDPARLNELFDRVDGAMRAVPDDDRFERIEQKIEEMAVPVERFDRLEKKIADTAAGAGADRFSQLEKKLDDIGRIFTAGGELLTQEDLTDLRSDIVALRRELRSSLPVNGQGETTLAEMMRTIVKRLERMPQGVPATAADLEAQIDRVARLIEDPSQSRMALEQLEAGIRTIEERLDETRRVLETQGPREDPAVAGIARALSDDVSVLKTSAEATERKTRDAIDAVQGTLEAVVKRMAFLERDADTAEDRRLAESRSAPLRKPAEPMLTAEFEPFEPPPQADEAVEAPDQPPPGLLSRLTSRQLLRRATGGRAESFSPEPEDTDDAGDIPLEPGTDSPLSSSLTGAPSSNTEFMSGARKGRPKQSSSSETDDPAASGLSESRKAVDDDFLAAARRAARAAAKEAVDTDDETPVLVTASGGGFLKSRRSAFVAAAIAAVIVIAALVVLRTGLWPRAGEIAILPESSAPVAEPESSISTAPTADAPESELTAAPAVSTAPASTEAEPAVPVEAPATEMASEPQSPVATSDDLRPEEQDAPATATDETVASAPADPMAAPATASESATEPEASVAAVAPSTSESATPAIETPAPQTPTTAIDLPEDIGPPRLRDSAIAGDPVAAFEVAARYAEGRGVLPDMTAAIVWYQRSAEAGLAPAQYRLGSIYEKGLGVPKDLEVAQTWYRRAADAGNVKAMHNLAVLYAEGAGGAPDLERASDLFRQAAERGVRDSQFNLAILHARGLGVPQDLIEAYKWFGIAASSGDAESAKRRDIIGEALSENDKAAAEEAVATFRPVPLASEANEVLIPDGGWSEIDNSTSVQVKDQNELVALVQKLLADNGFDPGPADGLLGEQTTEAIAKFQDKAGLPKTGKIDEELVAALQAPST